MLARISALTLTAILAAPVSAAPAGLPSIAERIERLDAEITAAFAALPPPLGAPAQAVPAQWGWGQQQPQQDDVGVRLSQMEGRMRQLTGQMEQLQHSLRRLEDQIRRFQEDTEFRFQEQQNQGQPQQRRQQQQRPQQRGDAPPAEAPSTSTLAAAPPAAAPAPSPPIAPAAPQAARQPLGAPPQNLGQVAADPGTGEPLDLVAGARGTLPPAAAQPAPPQQVAGVGGVGIVAGRTVTPVVAPANAREAYDAAYGYFLRGDYDLAQEAFQGYLTSYPRDRQAGDALYWLGESHYARRQWREAADAFLRSYTDFPQGQKAPESLLRLGMSMRQLGQQQAACASLAEVTRRYPRASQAVRQRVQTEQRGAGCA